MVIAAGVTTRSYASLLTAGLPDNLSCMDPFANDETVLTFNEKPVAGDNSSDRYFPSPCNNEEDNSMGVPLVILKFPLPSFMDTGCGMMDIGC